MWPEEILKYLGRLVETDIDVYMGIHLKLSPDFSLVTISSHEDEGVTSRRIKESLNLYEILREHRKTYLILDDFEQPSYPHWQLDSRITNYINGNGKEEKGEFPYRHTLIKVVLDNGKENFIDLTCNLVNLELILKSKTL